MELRVRIVPDVPRRIITSIQLTTEISKAEKPIVHVQSEGVAPWTSTLHSFAITLRSQER